MKLNPAMVREDPELDRESKTTSINFYKDDDRAIVFSDEAGIIRRLLQHPEAEPNITHMNINEDTEIHSYYGTIPTSCLKIMATPRKNSGHASVVSRAHQLQADDQAESNEGHTTQEEADALSEGAAPP